MNGRVAALVVVVALAVGGSLLVSSGSAASDTDDAAGLNTGPRSARERAAPVPERRLQTLWAVVDRDGNLRRDQGARSARVVNTGAYVVLFRQPIRRCSYIATIGLPGASGAEATGEVTVVGRAGRTNGVFLTTTNSIGEPAPRGFHLAVHC